MKTSFLLVLFFCVFNVNAQQNEKASFGFGAGLNFSGISLSSPESQVNPASLSGFKGNVFVEVPIGKGFYIQPELSFDGLGWQFDGDDNYAGGQQSNVKTYMNYLFLSILPKYKIENTGLSFYAGPSYGLLLSATIKGWGGETHSDKNNYTSGDFAGIIGTGYDFPVGIGIRAQYMLGISNIVSNAQDGESIHNHAFSISVVYKINNK